MANDKTQVGSPMNFRGISYKPINELGEPNWLFMEKCTKSLEYSKELDN